MKILNAYAGLGGNRKNWKCHEVTAIELDPKIASIYSRLYPDDTLIIADAHEYLRVNFSEFDFIWSSPPCQTHSKMNKATRHTNRRFPDMRLYEEILFLQHFFKGHWVVENVVPFYDTLIPATEKIGRHLFWSSSNFTADDVMRPKNFINTSNIEGKKALQEWLGIYYEENVYYGKNHCPAQILRNCVHPRLGEQILESILNNKQKVVIK